MTNIKIEIPECDGELAPWYHRYDGQTAPQEVFLEIREDGTVLIDWDAEIGNAVPVDVWEGRTHRINLPPAIRCDVAKEILNDREVQRLAQSIVNGNGDPDDLASYIEQHYWHDVEDNVWDAGDWLTCNGTLSDEYILTELWPSDVPLEKAVRELEEVAASDGIKLDGDLQDALLDILRERAWELDDPETELNGEHLKEFRKM